MVKRFKVRGFYSLQKSFMSLAFHWIPFITSSLYNSLHFIIFEFNERLMVIQSLFNRPSATPLLYRRWWWVVPSLRSFSHHPAVGRSLPALSSRLLNRALPTAWWEWWGNEWQGNLGTLQIYWKLRSRLVWSLVFSLLTVISLPVPHPFHLRSEGRALRPTGRNRRGTEWRNGGTGVRNGMVTVNPRFHGLSRLLSFTHVGRRSLRSLSPSIHSRRRRPVGEPEVGLRRRVKRANRRPPRVVRRVREARM